MPNDASALRLRSAVNIVPKRGVGMWGWRMLFQVEGQETAET